MAHRTLRWEATASDAKYRRRSQKARDLICGTRPEAVLVHLRVGACDAERYRNPIPVRDVEEIDITRSCTSVH